MFALTLVSTIILPLLVARIVIAQPAWTSDPFEPAAIPLAVRAPYLSAWLAGGHALSDSWPTLYQGSVLGWAGYVRVDGTAYRTMGLSNIDGQQVAEQLSVKITASASEFTLRAGNVELLYTFLSPVELNDLTKQSLPLSYFSIAARSTDGSAHIVEVYADISAEWVTGDVKNGVKWGFDSTTDGTVVTHYVERTEQAKFHEIAEHAEHGTTYFSTLKSDGLTFAQGADIEQRTMFVKDGKLDNQADTEFRAAGDRWPVLAFASTLSSVSGNGQLSEPVVFSIGQFRDPIVQFVTKTGQPEERAPYWLTAFNTPLEAITFFLNDYAMAVSSAATLNSKISTDAAAVSNNYVAILKLSLRQAVAAMELTVGRTNNVINPQDVMAFQKEISSNNNCNTVDVIFPQWPLFVYSNPAIGRALLEPLLRYAAMDLYPNRWAIHDLGSLYPNITGHNDGQDEHMPIEESANMIIMALSYAQKTNDLSMIKQYFQEFDGWAQYLVATTLLPAEQLSTDDFSKPIANHTNLAAKGIIGIAAMGEIAKLNGDAVKAERYTAIAKDMVPRWRALATSRDRTHLRLTYGDDASWGLMYNLYADRLLGLDLFPAEVYNLETAFYKTKLQDFGIILDTRANYTKSDWEIWVAAIADKELQSSLVDRVARYSSLADPKNAGMPFGDFYDVPTGTSRDFRARPVVGGHFAILALTAEPIGGGSTTSQSGPGPTGPTTSSNGPAGGQNGTPEIPDPNDSAMSTSSSLSQTALFFVLALVFLL